MDLNNIAGTKYKASQKINIKTTLILFFIAVLIAIGIGRLYAIINQINPIVYLNFLVLAGAVLLTAFLSFMVITIGNSRNKTINFLLILLIGIVAWLAQWSHILQNTSKKYTSQGFVNESFWSFFLHPLTLIEKIAQFAGERNISLNSVRTYNSRGLELDPSLLTILYFIEFIAFLIPAFIINRQKNYYCENCQTNFITKKGYIKESEIIEENKEILMTGDLSFLNNYHFYRTLDDIPLDPKDKPLIGFVEMHNCPTCNKNAIVNIKLETLKYNDKNKREVNFFNDYLLEDTYATEQTQSFLKLKLW